MTLLSVRNLRVTPSTRRGEFQAVRGVSFDLAANCRALWKNPGPSKAMTGHAILGLVRPPRRVGVDRMEVEGQSTLNLPERRMRQIRGKRISMVMQDP